MKCRGCRRPMDEVRDAGVLVGFDCPGCHMRMSWCDAGYPPPLPVRALEAPSPFAPLPGEAPTPRAPHPNTLPVDDPRNIAWRQMIAERMQASEAVREAVQARPRSASGAFVRVRDEADMQASNA